jgi:hypothetical protein
MIWDTMVVGGVFKVGIDLFGDFLLELEKKFTFTRRCGCKTIEFGEGEVGNASDWGRKI